MGIYLSQFSPIILCVFICDVSYRIVYGDGTTFFLFYSDRQYVHTHTLRIHLCISGISI